MLKDKVAIITGGTRGIGFAIVRKFLQNGAKVALLGSRQESVDRALQHLQKEGFTAIGFCPKLSDEDALRKCFKQVEKAYGKVNILVNNAGVASGTRLIDYTESEENSIVELNFMGVYKTCKAVVPFMTNGGVILNASSVVSLYGQSVGCLYPATKYAVNGLTKSLSRELADKNIRVNAVAPGVTDTDMVRNLPENLVKPLIDKIPLKRFATAEDIANAYMFLASDMASYITGVVLSVDGGAMI